MSVFWFLSGGVSGCGSASGNAYCSNKGGCIDVSDYSASFSTDVFSAEVGDWNGKYGLITLDGNKTVYRMDSSFFEVTPDDMDILNMSVVFHCNGGSRAFCAPFVESSDEVSYSIPEQGMIFSVITSIISTVNRRKLTMSQRNLLKVYKSSQVA